MVKKFFVASLAMAVTVPAVVAPLPMEAKASATFSDLSTLSKQDKEKIETLVNLNVINGFKDGTFRPYAKVTRGQYASFIANALELPASNVYYAFKDVTENIATYDGIDRAVGANVVNGYKDGSFRPNDEISRSDMAIMLNNALQYQAKFNEKASLTYSDANSIGKSAYGAVQRVTKYGIMGAQADNAFKPEMKGNRLETVLSIYQLLATKDLLNSQRPEKPNKPSNQEEVDPTELWPIQPPNNDIIYDAGAQESDGVLFDDLGLYN